MAWKVQKRQVLDTQVSSATSYHHGEVSLVKVWGVVVVVGPLWRTFGASQINMELFWNPKIDGGGLELEDDFSFTNWVMLGFFNVNFKEQMSNDKYSLVV